MYRLLRFAWIVSALLYFVALMLSYAFLPEQVGIQANENSMPMEFIERDTFFFFGLGFFIVTNLLLSVLLSVMNSVPETSGFYFKSEVFKEGITSWICAFVTVINLFLVTTVTYVALFNNQGDYQISQFNWIIYIAPLLFVASLVWLVTIFFKR